MRSLLGRASPNAANGPNAAQTSHAEERRIILIGQKHARPLVPARWFCSRSRNRRQLPDVLVSNGQLDHKPWRRANRISYVISPEGKSLYAYSDSNAERQIENTLVVVRKSIGTQALSIQVPLGRSVQFHLWLAISSQRRQKTGQFPLRVHVIDYIRDCPQILGSALTSPG